jgi:predicted O-methyltransferase YrrM
MHEDKIFTLIYQFKRFGILSHWMPNAIGLWPNEQECILWLALNSSAEVNWMEIGSFCGGSAVLMCLARQMLTENHPAVYSVDCDFDKYGMFDKNVYGMGGFARISKKIECDSNDLEKHYSGDPLSFVFIDGFHSFEQVVNDFNKVLPWLTEDATVAFHDVSPSLTNNIDKKYDYDELFQNSHEDFRLDEAVSYILENNKDFSLIDIPVKKDILHFKETNLKKWVRGKTSPFNALAAIRRNQ